MDNDDQSMNPCNRDYPVNLCSWSLFGLAVATNLHAQEIPWTANGRDLQGTRYLPASVITRANVARLEVAWTYRTGEMGPQFKTTKETSFEATPLVVEGTMYVG